MLPKQRLDLSAGRSIELVEGNGCYQRVAARTPGARPLGEQQAE
jgi:hypothetical protein